jgi:RHS repeat-associated protein
MDRQYFEHGFMAFGGKYYYIKDHLGTVWGLYGQNGAPHGRWRFTLYGERGNNEVTNLPMNSDMGFTGHYQHVPSGLVLAPYRAYDPETARWLSRDPIGEAGGINLYGYVLNNPVNLWDPWGLWQVTIGGGAGIGGMITFGYNSGQFNFGGFVGAGEGFFGSIDFGDSGCEKIGLSTGGRAATEVGASILGGRRFAGISGDSRNSYMSNRNKTEPSLGLGYGGNKWFGMGVPATPGGVSFSGGFGAFVGVGATTVIGSCK